MVNDRSLEKLELEIAMMVRRLRHRAPDIDEKQKLQRASYFIMLILADKGPMGVKDMSDRLHLDVSTVSRQAGDLLKKEFLKKTPSEMDKRSYKYEMTDKGEQVLESNRESREERFRKMIDRWDAEEIEEFARLLKKFNSLTESD